MPKPNSTGPRRGSRSDDLSRADRRLRVAVVDEGLPYPLTGGKPIRSFSLISRLAKKHDITYFAQRNADSKSLEQATQKLSSLGIKSVIVNHTIPPDRGMAFGFRLFRNLFSPLPYSVQRHISAPLMYRVRTALSSFDLWHCEWTPYVELFRSTQVNRLVINAHNIESLIWQRYVECEQNRLKRWYIRRQWHKFKIFERWALMRASQTVVVSEGDSRLAKTEFDAQDVTIVENGVDTGYFKPHDLNRDPLNLLIVGSLNWRPNTDGIRMFLDEQFPKIVDAKPAVRLRIVGRAPPNWLLKRVAADDRVEVHGDVSDIRPFIQDAGMLVVPLRVGGGSRLKILEAAAAGLPVVSTRIGAEGLEMNDAKHYFAADSIAELSKVIVRCIDNYEECKTRAVNARQLVVQTYDWDLLAQKLDQVWQRAYATTIDTKEN